MKTKDTHSNPERCMKCGFCLSPCPIYSIDHRESHAPRGRNILIQKANKKEISFEDTSYQNSLHYCLVCGRCKAVCPSKLSPGEITHAARARLYLTSERFKASRVENQKIINDPSSAPMVKKFTAQQGTLLQHRNESLHTHLPEQTVQKTKGKVALFAGCVFTCVLTEMKKDCIDTLTAAGYDVVVSDKSTCCGQDVWLMGDLKTARKMATRNIEALHEYDYIVTGCASCGAALKNYSSWFSNDSVRKEQAKVFSEKVYDFVQFLVANNIQLKSRFTKPVKVTYHDPCYLKFTQNIFTEPRKILSSIENVEFVEMDLADSCCGDGLFGNAHNDIGHTMLKKKIDSIRRSGADVVVTSCSGCILNIAEGLKNENLAIPVMHISQLITNKQ